MSFTVPAGDFKKKLKKKIIPLPDYLFEKNKTVAHKKRRGMSKYSGEYHEFVKWSALPNELRIPKTQREFEVKHKLTPFKTSQWKMREDFYPLRLQYFFDWLYDEFPNVVYGIIKRAKRHSSADAKIFVDLLSKKLDLDKPKINMTPIFMVGVSQEKIDEFMVPEGYEGVVKKTVEEIKKSDRFSDIVEEV